MAESTDTSNRTSPVEAAKKDLSDVFESLSKVSKFKPQAVEIDADELKSNNFKEQEVAEVAKKELLEKSTKQQEGAKEQDTTNKETGGKDNPERGQKAEANVAKEKDPERITKITEEQQSNRGTADWENTELKSETVQKVEKVDEVKPQDATTEPKEKDATKADKEFGSKDADKAKELENDGDKLKNPQNKSSVVLGEFTERVVNASKSENVQNNER